MTGVRYMVARQTMRHRGLTLGLLLGITAFFAAGLPQVDLRTIFSDLLPKDHDYVRVFKDHPNFGNPLTVTVMVKRKGGDIYNAETLAKVWDMTRDIDLAPAVDHDQVLSIATEKARYAEATPYGIDSRPLMGDRPPRTEAEIEAFRLAVDKSPASRRFLISTDGTATIIQATFIERLIDYGDSFAHVQAVVEDNRDENHDVHLAGQPALTGWVYYYQGEMLSIFAVTLTALLVALIFYMRNVSGVVTPIVASIVAAIWGFGFVGWLGFPIEPLIMVVPLLLVARSFSHSVQFIERYNEIHLHLGNRRKAAELTLTVMMAPGALGIFTDAAGLFLIALAPIPAMERFALFCGFWAMILVPANLFLVPLLLSWLPEPGNIRRVVGQEEGAGHARLKVLLGHIASFSHGPRAWPTAVAVAVLLSIALYLMTQIQLGHPVEGSNLLYQDSEFNTAVSAINRNFPGLNTLEVIFEAKNPEERERVARQAETIATMHRLQYLVESSDAPPRATLSFADYLPEANRLFSGGNPKWAPLDPTPQAVNAAASAVMVGTSPKAFLHVTDFEQQHATVSLWYKNNKQETIDEALRVTYAALDKIGLDHKAFVIRLGSGVIALQQAINDTVDVYQWVILGALNLVILVTCSLAYRSLTAGILLLIPVNMANAFLIAVLVLMEIGLDVNTLPITAIGIGIGIDYGIYLLSRICEEYQIHKDYGSAILASVKTTGKAIFFTAVIVLIGILPWYFLSELKFLADMGLMLVLVMLINMLIALIVLPLLVWFIQPRFVRSENLRIGEGLDLTPYLSTDPEPRPSR